jgi:hypothetical protein
LISERHRIIDELANKGDCPMARHTPQVKLDLQRITEQRDRLIMLLQDAYDIIEAADDPDCKNWLSLARYMLEEARA